MQDLPNLDDELTKLPSDILSDLAERGRGSLYFLSKAILGYKDLTPPCHGPLCEFVDSSPSRFKLILMPRDHYKTSVVTISGNIQRVIRNPEERILIANETSLNAERFLGSIRQHAETNRIFRTLYSDIIPKDARRTQGWNNQELTFIRQGKYPEPTIDCIGMTGTMTSRHYTHMCFDDPISEEAVKSEKVMQDTINRIVKLQSLFVKPETDTFWLVGTRWAFNDVYSHFIDIYGNRLTRFIRGVLEDGEPIFPELMTPDTIALIRSQYGEYMFSCLYMNNPRNPDVQDFNVNDLRFWRPGMDGHSVVMVDQRGEPTKVWDFDQLQFYTTVDLAPAEVVGADRNAIVTTAVTPDSDIIVWDTWAKRCSPLQVMEHLFYLHGAVNPRIGIEDVAYQKAFKHFLKAESERRGVYLRVQPVKSVSRKEIRIRGLQPIAATGHLYISPNQHLLRNEMADFPLGKHDDVLDALSMQLQIWPPHISLSRWDSYKKAENRLIQRIMHPDRFGTSDDGELIEIPSPPIYEYPLG